MRAGADTAVDARRSARVPGCGVLNPAIGGTAPAAPHNIAATTAAAPLAPLSPIAPLIDVTIVSAPPNISVSAAASTASSAAVAFAEAYTTSTSDAATPASS